MEKRIYYGCPNCPEPKTTLEKGAHVFLLATAVNYGTKCEVVISCSVCGFVDNVTDSVKQVSKNEIDKLLVGSH